MDFIKNISEIFKELIKEKDFSFIALVLAIFLLPLSIILSSYALVISIFLKILQVVFFKHKLYALNLLKTSSIIGLVFFVYVILNSIIQTDFLHTINFFEQEFIRLPLLFLIPIVLRKRNHNNLLYYALLFGILISSFYVLIMCFLQNINFDKFAFLNILNIHHTYLSIYILFVVNKILFSFYKKKSIIFKGRDLISLGILLFSFFLIFILGSKASMVIYLLFIGAYILVFFSSRKRILIISSLILITSFIVFNKTISTSYRAALDFRIEIWQEAYSAIKENPFFGNLKMSEKNILNLKHYTTGKYYLMDSDLNSHNQYLSIVLKFGIVGLLVLIILGSLIFKSRNLKIQNSNFINVLGFCIIMLAIFYIENILDRHHGVVFVVVFFNYYLTSIDNEKI